MIIMDKVIKILKINFWTRIIIVAVIATVMETETIVLTGDYKNSEFLVVSIMELVTLALLPAALYLFRIKKVRMSLEESQSALLKWGLIRICMIGLPMIANTLLYYIYMNVSFGYMAIICLICMPFIYPGKGRCLNETSINE